MIRIKNGLRVEELDKLFCITFGEKENASIEELREHVKIEVKYLSKLMKVKDYDERSKTMFGPEEVIVYFNHSDAESVISEIERLVELVSSERNNNVVGLINNGFDYIFEEEEIKKLELYIIKNNEEYIISLNKDDIFDSHKIAETLKIDFLEMHLIMYHNGSVYGDDGCDIFKSLDKVKRACESIINLVHTSVEDVVITGIIVVNKNE